MERAEKCTVCSFWYYRDIRVPYKTCKNNHNICERCFDKLENIGSQCPECRMDPKSQKVWDKKEISSHVQQWLKENDETLKSLNDKRKKVEELRLEYEQIQVQIQGIKQRQDALNKEKQTLQNKLQVLKQRQQEVKNKLLNNSSGKEAKQDILGYLVRSLSWIVLMLKCILVSSISWIVFMLKWKLVSSVSWIVLKCKSVSSVSWIVLKCILVSSVSWIIFMLKCIKKFMICPAMQVIIWLIQCILFLLTKLLQQCWSCIKSIIICVLNVSFWQVLTLLIGYLFCYFWSYGNLSYIVFTYVILRIF